MDFASPAPPSPLAEEIAGRAVALVAAGPRVARRGTPLSRPILRRLDACERRAQRLHGGDRVLGAAAALAFLGDVCAALTIDGAWDPGDARIALEHTAGQLGIAPASVLFAAYRGAVTGGECADLPPATATRLILGLLIELAPITSVSLWHVDDSGRTELLAGAGHGSGSRRMRDAGRCALDGVLAHGESIQSTIVQRWEHPYGALVARARNGTAARCMDFVDDAAAALAPVLERDALFDRSAAREHELVAAGERRLVRLGFDLHDGALQELVAFADDLRLAAGQVDSLLDDRERPLVRGRFADLEARLGYLDGELRQLVRSVSSTTAMEQPLEQVLRCELDALTHSSGIDADIVFEGDLTGLTNSQRIVIFRVVQESLANVRKHSHATRASVAVRSTARFIRVTIEDDGCGFDVEETVENVRRAGRFGLAGVLERVRLLGGDVEIDCVVGGGTTVRTTIPQWSPGPEHDGLTIPVYKVTA